MNNPIFAAQDLQPDSRGACVRVDLNAIAYNTKMLKDVLGNGVRMMAVVKANAYGHGIIPAARTVLANGAEYLGVAVPEEGELLRNEGIDAPCLVLGNVSKYGARVSVRAGLIQTVCDAEGVRLMQKACEQADMQAQVHLKLDTGMSRIGARTKEEILSVLDALKAADRVHLTGAFTHFAEAGNEVAVRRQFDRFNELKQYLPEGILLHTAASEAALKYPYVRLDMVRLGIALYGGAGKRLHRAMRWETRVAYVKEIRAGDKVSYGGIFCADKPMRVATIAVGYGDGYLRAFSGRAQVLIGGKRCDVLGRVCMDQTMVDVSHLDEVHAGDEVVLLGTQQDECITPEEMALWADTICYEVLMLHAGRVPMIIEE